ncbi:MAG TPA: aspartate aminotransferase family protein [Vitreimonas sp.]|nr:aspartate aminotransferase family protein [Vitreimonas sp.]
MTAPRPAATEPIRYPGAEARATIARIRAVEGAGPRTWGSDAPLVVESALGSTLTDPDGNRFMDLSASFAAATIGHAHPDVVRAVQEQIGRLSHVSSAFVSEPRAAFQEALVGIAQEGLDRVLLGMSGADANDVALKLARTLTGRREVLAFSGGYFGRGGGVVGVNGKTRFRTSVGRDSEAHFLPFPFAYRWPLGSGEDAGGQAIALATDAIESPASGIGPLAAIVVEPVQGNGGIVVPPAGFLEGLRALCDRHGIVLIFDEIQCGFGRTGRIWAAEHWGVVPDLMTVGKGIGGGLALSAVLGSAATMSHWPPGTHTSTFMGNAVNLAAGRAAIDVLVRDRLWERAARLGARLIGSLREQLGDLDHVGEVRGLGLFAGIEVVRDRPSRLPDPDRARRIRDAAFERGVIVGAAGHHDNVLKVCPPLTIDEAQLDDAVGVLVEASREGQ